ncbi:uncharacterized protein LOC118808720 [Colossoma macropomum]|uniref:uncharacterized protein LOC118808720 n=1 Tax=Colossoma macropomum TaxID=42526 RepID=UPI0018642C1F|nr:uncharacterized protein LOC118808720 [Colossoma macropomum]XP_036427499.1 uncharacterized protein LOC118808720 [Colossoma macropomum]
MYKGYSVRMPESCVNINMCGTHAPLWINGAHPQLQDGVVTRQICGNWNSDCCNFKSNPIRVKACPGNYYVYEFVSPSGCSLAYCADVRVAAPTPTYQPLTISNSADPCYSYTVLDEPWRATNYSDTVNAKCDQSVSWVGWYRLMYKGYSVRMPESCVNINMCGTHAPLWINGTHPQLQDGVVTRQICGNWDSDCCNFRSNPIRVKACPGNYYVYEFVKPSHCRLAYCADMKVMTQTVSSSADPCYSYTVLDEPWRATNFSNTANVKCDQSVSWVGWYRLMYKGYSVRMPESCVNINMCGTHAPLWINGAHPQLQDGVVTRQICGNWGSNCCNFKSKPIRVKACPGNYYVYEFVKPSDCSLAYCADVAVAATPTPTYQSLTNDGVVTPTSTYQSLTSTEVTTQTVSSSADPCLNYTVLDEPWRATNYSNTVNAKCDQSVSWVGWYRLMYNGQDVRMPESCVDIYMCGTHAPLWINGAHPQLQDGVVTRQICGNWNGNCCNFKSNPIRVKACPGNYYVYEFVSPSDCWLAYCADTEVTTQTVSSSADPCYSYTVLDEPWRATNYSNTVNAKCDQSVTWVGWYRLMYNGQDVRMPESCVDVFMCGTHTPLWINGTHPELQDGVVTRQICGNWNSNCCNFRSNPIQVKACPGNYYVYKFVKPSDCWLAYCADVTTAHGATNIPPLPKHLVKQRKRRSSANNPGQTSTSEGF